MSTIKRTVTTSTINCAQLDSNLQPIQAEPLVLIGDFSDRDKAQKALNKKALGFVVTSVDIEETVYALDLEVFMEHATIVEPSVKEESEEQPSA